MSLWIPERQIIKSTQIKLNIKLKRQNVRQIEVLRFIRIATPISGEARQHYFSVELNRG